MKKQSIILSSAIAALLTSGVAVAELTANGAVSNNYIWRGMTQTGDVAAVSGGVDWTDDSGLYAGAWVSNLGAGGGQEVDLYVGMGLEVADEMGLDVGAILYEYPVTPNGSFAEVYANVNVQMITFGAAITLLSGSANANAAFDTGDIYLSVAADLDENIAVHAGTYMFDAAGATDYIHYGASYSKDELTFSIDKNDAGGVAGRMRVGISYSMEWEL